MEGQSRDAEKELMNLCLRFDELVGAVRVDGQDNVMAPKGFREAGLQLRSGILNMILNKNLNIRRDVKEIAKELVDLFQEFIDQEYGRRDGQDWEGFKHYFGGIFHELVNEVALEEPSDVELAPFPLEKGILPDDIYEILDLTYREVEIDYQNECYISAICLCGKLIETVLSSLYERIFSERADEKKYGIDAIINRLRNQGYRFDPAIKEALGIVNLHRNQAVHGHVAFPTKDEAQGIISLTRNVMAKLAPKKATDASG